MNKLLSIVYCLQIRWFHRNSLSTSTATFITARPCSTSCYFALRFVIGLQHDQSRNPAQKMNLVACHWWYVDNMSVDPSWQVFISLSKSTVYVRCSSRLCAGPTSIQNAYNWLSSTSFWSVTVSDVCWRHVAETIYCSLYYLVLQ